MSDSARVFDETAIHDEEKPTPSERTRIEDTAALVPDDCRSVVDVGCGRGEILRRLRTPLRVGTDFARRALRHVGTPVLRSSIFELPFRTGSFDTVICAETLEHLDPARLADAARELRRVAKRHVIVTVPWEENLLLRSHRCPKCRTVFHVDGHRSSFRAEDLQALFPDAKGFVVRGSWRVRPWSRTLLRLRTDVLDLWKWVPHTICPACGNREIENHEDRLLYRALGALNGIVNPRRSRWGWLLLRADF